MEDRERFLRAAWVNVAGNLLKIVVEGGIGLAFGSLALVADAAHSLADLLASLVVLVWGRLTFEGPDRTHPHGHERIEPLTALFVGVTLIALAGKLFYDTVMAVLEGPSVRYSPILVGGLAFAILSMWAVYWYTQRANEGLGSPALDALAADSRNDILTSMAAVVGVFGVAAGYPILDPVAGGLVSLLVLQQGVAVARENVDYLVGSAPPEETADRLRGAVLDHPEVEGVHDFRAFYVGPEVEVELHVEIDGDRTLREAHDVETDIRRRLLDDPAVGDAHVHLDPSGLGEWKDAEEDRPTAAERGSHPGETTARDRDRDARGRGDRGAGQGEPNA